MIDSRNQRICLVPQLSGVGGMVSFQQKFAAGLNKRGLDVCYDLDDTPYAAVLVIGGTRRLQKLWSIRRSGIRIVQRLNGMNWLHRLRKRNGPSGTSLKHFIRSEYGNIILALIRSHLADFIVYQSEFAEGWWGRVRGPAPVPGKVIYNAVDLDVFSPRGKHQRPENTWRILLVEGSLMGGYETGLEVATGLAAHLARSQSPVSPGKVELMVVGRVTQEVRNTWDERLANGDHRYALTWAGQVPGEKIPQIDRSAHLLYSADVNAACPNSVIEALACGLPVVSFDTGALPELVSGDSGRVVPYGGDPWKLDPPDIPALEQAALEILQDQKRFREGARARAEQYFGLDKMVEDYLNVLLEY